MRSREEFDMLNEEDLNKKKIYNSGPIDIGIIPSPTFTGTYTSTPPGFDINSGWANKEIEISLNHPDAKVPVKDFGNGGYDLVSVEDAVVLPGGRSKVDTGISIALPHNWVGLIWPRSGLAVKSGIDIMAGVIDSSYRGNIMVCLYNTSFESVHLPKGSKIAQYIIQRYETVNFKVVDKLPESERGEKGFGSSG